MRQILILITIILLSVASYGQDTIRIKHINYTTVFSKSKRYPVLVEWWDTKAKSSCKSQLDRKDQFQKDPKLPQYTSLGADYVNGGYDRGHMCPAADNECLGTQVLTECFYFSNMAPQPHPFNAGIWKTLETLTRNLSLKNDSVHVWAGSVGSIKTIGKDNVSVPTQCWKVIYIKSLNQKSAYLFNNTAEKVPNLDSRKVDVKVIEKLTGFKFN